MSPMKKTDITTTPKKGVQLKFKKHKDVPKTSLSPKKLGNNSSVIIIGSAFGLVFARTTHPTKPGEDAYTYDAKRMLIENPEKAATLNCINVRALVVLIFYLFMIFVLIVFILLVDFRLLTGEKKAQLTPLRFKQADTIPRCMYLN
jgi:hypothetical protein